MRPKWEAPNIKPKPNTQKITVPMQRSITFFITMFPEFLPCAKPVSTMQKPACIKKTKAAPRSTHRVSIDE